MDVRSFTVGPVQENCYLVRRDGSDRAVIVDPGEEADRLLGAIERLGAKRDGVLRSHQVMDGRVRDIVVYSIIACEWPGVRANLRFLLDQGDRT